MPYESAHIIPQEPNPMGLLPRLGGYAVILQEKHISYSVDGDYITAGRSAIASGWVLHLTSDIAGLPGLISKISEYHIRAGIPFKIPVDEETAISILNGLKGYAKLGKVITLYPGNVDQAKWLATALIAITQEAKGPSILTDAYLGGQVYVRYGAHLSGVPDHYTIPFQLPADLSWPFEEFAPVVAESKKPALLNRYRPVKLLKNDAKGDVFKALYLKNTLTIKWALLKQGKKNMLSDTGGRDIRDRLRFQRDLLIKLSPHLPVPQLFEYLEDDNGDTYLTTQFFKGQSLENRVQEIYRHRTWKKLPLRDRLEIIAYAEQILRLISRLHQCGIIHRDINPANFMITKGKALGMIDLELAYDKERNYPNPPFRLGTPWYMSPEQQMAVTPTEKEDIYAIGAMLAALLTNLSPGKFATEDPELIANQLSFFFDNQPLAALIGRCLSKIRKNRPDIETIRRQLSDFKKEQTTIALQKETVSDGAVKAAIYCAFKGLHNPMLWTEEQLWSSKTIQPIGLDYYQQEDRTTYGGLAVGLTGILRVLSTCEKLGYEPGDLRENRQKAVHYLRQTSDQAELPGGYFLGSHGIATGLYGVETSGNRLLSLSAAEHIKRLLAKPGIGPSLADGLAGQGMAILNCPGLIGDPGINQLLETVVLQLIDLQDSDGSWAYRLPDGKKFKPADLVQGVAGITAFLNEYVRIYPGTTEGAIVQAAGWMMKNAAKQELLSPERAQIGYVLLRSQQLIGKRRCEEYLWQLFRDWDEDVVISDFSLLTGLSGIGIFFLEAYQAFGTDIWKRRADGILRLLMKVHRNSGAEGMYWLADASPSTTADLGGGNAGILAFLVKAANPDKCGHPLLIF